MVEQAERGMCVPTHTHTLQMRGQHSVHAHHLLLITAVSSRTSIGRKRSPTVSGAGLLVCCCRGLDKASPFIEGIETRWTHWRGLMSLKLYNECVGV